MRPSLLEAPELVPVVPFADQVGVGDKHPRGPLVGAEHADRAARLNQQGLVVVQPATWPRWHRSWASRGRPCRRPAVDDQFVGMLGHLRVEIVVEHSPGRFLGPRPAVQIRSGGRLESPGSGGGHVALLCSVGLGWVWFKSLGDSSPSSSEGTGHRFGPGQDLARDDHFRHQVYLRGEETVRANARYLPAHPREHGSGARERVGAASGAPEPATTS